MKKKLTRLFSVLLAAVLVFGTLPVSALGTDVADPPASAVDESVADESSAAPEAESAVDDAAQPEEQSAEEEAVAVQSGAAVDGYTMNIFFLDCGRKYYSVSTIKKFIDVAAENNFNYIQLAVGNDGLRFLLDNMELTVNGTTYSSENVSSAIHAGNEAYYNFDVDELTESDMDTIIAYANSKGMGVIPCVNTPGHMDAILSAATSLTGTNCSYNGSARTIDVTNTTAVDFTQALLQKYITYFAGKGCEYFNMGADEYANDKYLNYDGMGFGVLQRAGQYGKYASYINDVAKMIKSSQMSPMAFNDGIYYGGDETYTFDDDIIICYWSSGWGTYAPMPASTLASKGFKLVNTHGDYYWVLGKSDVQCSASKASGFNYKSFQGSTIDDPVGSMFCIWADYPGSMSEDDVLSGTAATIAAFGKTLPQFEVDDGSIKISIGDSTEIATAGNLTVGSETVLRANKAVTWTTSDETVASIASADADEVSTQSTEVNAKAITVTAGEVGTATITATDGEQTTEFAVTVQEMPTEDIYVSVNGTATRTVDGNVTAGAIEDPDIATVATEAVETADGDNKVYTPLKEMAAGTYYVSAKANDTAPTVQVTITKSGNSYYLQYNNTYYYPNASYDWDYSTWNRKWNYTVATATRQNRNVTITGTGSDGAFTVSRSVSSNQGGSTTSYLTLSGDPFDATGSPTTLYFYEQKDATKAQTKITFTGVAEGVTSVVIGGVQYNIHVIAEDLENAASREIQYWITNQYVYPSTGSTVKSIQLSAKDAYGENGVELSKLVLSSGVNENGKKVVFWKGTRLKDGNHQEHKSGVDKTKSGDDFTYIRYYEKQWSFLNKDGEWETFNSDDQVVAYYMQRTEVTDEVTTDVVDWGEERSGYKDAKFALLDFAVKYESGTRVPDSFPVAGKTIAYHCDTSTDNLNKTVFKDEAASKEYNEDIYYRTIGSIRAVASDAYEVYMITLTPNSDDKSTSDSATTGYTAAASTEYSYKGTEKVVWVDDVDNLPEEFQSADRQAEGYSTGGEPLVGSVSIYNQHAMLVTYYVRPKPTPDALTVHYVDETNGADGEEFYQYQISVKKGTYFDENVELNKKGPLPNGKVTNIKGKEETVTSDLSKMSGVAADKRYANYECIRVERRDEGKELWLFYTFKTAATFVVDFGTPLKIQLSDINADLASNKDKLTNVEVFGKTHGDAVVDKSDWSVTYTPDERFVSSDVGESLSIKYTGTANSKEDYVTYSIKILPASNVLYEENFLEVSKTEATSAPNPWTASTVKHEAAQETQLANQEKSPFGYDKTYASITEENGAWKAANLEVNSFYRPITTSFYGNTFDLIGNCGPKTGRVTLVFKNADGGYEKVVDIDTRYSVKNIYQVPLAHVTLGETDANHTVLIYTTGLAATTATQNIAVMAADGMAADASADEYLNQILADNGLTLDEVEYVSTSVMNEMAVAANAVDLYSAQLASDGTETYVSGHEAGDHVEINGFRVYRSTDENDSVAKYYPMSEQNMTYWNILDVVGSTIEAYVDDETVTSISVKEYEKAGGPQNEIYLDQKQAVTIQVKDAAQIQVSLRAVSDDVTWNSDNTIQSNTEMYYTLKPDTNGTFTIMNTSGNLLAIGNVKIPEGATVVSAENLDAETVLASVRAAYGNSSEPEEVFEPTKFTVSKSVTKLVRNQVVTLKINVSSDVAYVTVDGVKYTRSGLQGLFQKTRTIRVVKTAPKNEEKTYEIIAYNSDGVASEPVTITVK